MKLVFILPCRRYRGCFQQVKVCQWIAKKSWITVDNLVVPQVGIVAVRTQEVIFIERCALDIGIRLISGWVGTGTWHLASLRKCRCVQENAIEALWNKNVEKPIFIREVAARSTAGSKE